MSIFKKTATWLVALTLIAGCKKNPAKPDDNNTNQPPPEPNLREIIVGVYTGVAVINSGIERLAPATYRIEAAEDNRFRIIDQDSIVITLITDPSVVDMSVLSATIPTQQIVIRNITYDFFGEGNHLRYTHNNRNIRIQYKAQRPGFMSGTTVSFAGTKQ